VRCSNPFSPNTILPHFSHHVFHSTCQVEKCSKARSNGGRVLAHECFSLGYFRNWTTLAKVAQTVLIRASRTKSEEVCGLALLPTNRRDVRNITTTDDIMITIYMILLTFTDGQRKYHVAVPHPLLFIVAGSVHIHL
jgi:hypothetical protein